MEKHAPPRVVYCVIYEGGSESSVIGAITLLIDMKRVSVEYEGGSESSVIGIITLLINMIGCCIIP